ncbi:MAG: GNAT family N-acetyltransferase [Candidatus Omnitrophota bacterium]|nr:GNAT family N-acetyltransferase [Candidatus Omnitrophota bacterium]
MQVEDSLIQSVSGIRGNFGLSSTISDPAKIPILARAYVYATDTLQRWEKAGTPLPREIIFLVGTDTRPTKDAFRALQIAGFYLAAKDQGIEIKVYDVGVVTTPVMETAMRLFQAIGGVMITASHNPPEENGLKYFAGFREPEDGSLNQRGGVLSFARASALMASVANFMGNRQSVIALGRRLDSRYSIEAGEVFRKVAEATDDIKVEARREKAIKEYIKEIMEILQIKQEDLPALRQRIRSIKLAVDANGSAACGITAYVLRYFGFQVEEINVVPGEFNHQLEPINHAMNDIIAEIRRRGADAGGVPDGDADRMTFAFRGKKKGKVIVMGPQPVVYLNFINMVAWVLRQKSFDPQRYPEADSPYWAVVTNEVTSNQIRDFCRMLGEKIHKTVRVFQTPLGESVVVGKMHELEIKGDESGQKYFVIAGMEGSNSGTMFRGTEVRDGTLALLLSGLVMAYPEAMDQIRSFCPNEVAAKRVTHLPEFLQELPSNTHYQEDYVVSSNEVLWEFHLKIKEAFEAKCIPVTGKEGAFRVSGLAGVWQGVAYTQTNRPFKIELVDVNNRRHFVAISVSATQKNLLRIFADSPDKALADALIRFIRNLSKEVLKGQHARILGPYVPPAHQSATVRLNKVFSLIDGTTCEVIPLTRDFAINRGNEVLDLINEVPGSHWDLAKLLEEYPAKWGNSFAIVDRGGKVIAVVLAYKQVSNPELQIEVNHIFIRRLCVAVPCRRQYIGSYLLYYLSGYSIQNTPGNYSHIALQTSVDNEAANATYRSLGFNNVATIEVGGHHDNIYLITTDQLYLATQAKISATQPPAPPASGQSAGQKASLLNWALFSGVGLGLAVYHPWLLLLVIPALFIFLSICASGHFQVAVTRFGATDYLAGYKALNSFAKPVIEAEERWHRFSTALVPALNWEFKQIRWFNLPWVYLLKILDEVLSKLMIPVMLPLYLLGCREVEREVRRLFLPGTCAGRGYDFFKIFKNWRESTTGMPWKGCSDKRSLSLLTIISASALIAASRIISSEWSRQALICAVMAGIIALVLIACRKVLVSLTGILSLGRVKTSANSATMARETMRENLLPVKAEYISLLIALPIRARTKILVSTTALISGIAFLTYLFADQVNFLIGYALLLYAAAYFTDNLIKPSCPGFFFKLFNYFYFGSRRQPFKSIPNYIYSQIKFRLSHFISLLIEQAKYIAGCAVSQVKKPAFVLILLAALALAAGALLLSLGSADAGQQVAAAAPTGADVVRLALGTLVSPIGGVPWQTPNLAAVGTVPTMAIVPALAMVGMAPRKLTQRIGRIILSVLMILSGFSPEQVMAQKQEQAVGQKSANADQQKDREQFGMMLDYIVRDAESLNNYLSWQKYVTQSGKPMEFTSGWLYHGRDGLDDAIRDGIVKGILNEESNSVLGDNRKGSFFTRNPYQWAPGFRGTNPLSPAIFVIEAKDFNKLAQRHQAHLGIMDTDDPYPRINDDFDLMLVKEIWISAETHQRYQRIINLPDKQLTRAERFLKPKLIKLYAEGTLKVLADYWHSRYKGQFGKFDAFYRYISRYMLSRGLLMTEVPGYKFVGKPVPEGEISSSYDAVELFLNKVPKHIVSEKELLGLLSDNHELYKLHAVVSRHLQLYLYLLRTYGTGPPLMVKILQARNDPQGQPAQLVLLASAKSTHAVRSLWTGIYRSAIDGFLLDKDNPDARFFWYYLTCVYEELRRRGYAFDEAGRHLFYWAEHYNQVKQQVKYDLAGHNYTVGDWLKQDQRALEGKISHRLVREITDAIDLGRQKRILRLSSLDERTNSFQPKAGSVSDLSRPVSPTAPAAGQSAGQRASLLNWALFSGLGLGLTVYLWHLGSLAGAILSLVFLAIFPLFILLSICASGHFQVAVTRFGATDYLAGFKSLNSFAKLAIEAEESWHRFSTALVPALNWEFQQARWLNLPWVYALKILDELLSKLLIPVMLSLYLLGCREVEAVEKMAGEEMSGKNACRGTIISGPVRAIMVHSGTLLAGGQSSQLLDILGKAGLMEGAPYEVSTYEDFEEAAGEGITQEIKESLVKGGKWRGGKRFILLGRNRSQCLWAAFNGIYLAAQEAGEKGIEIIIPWDVTEDSTGMGISDLTRLYAQTFRDRYLKEYLLASGDENEYIRQLSNASPALSIWFAPDFLSAVHYLAQSKTSSRGTASSAQLGVRPAVTNTQSLTGRLQWEAVRLGLPWTSETPVLLWVGKYLGAGPVKMFNCALQAEGPKVSGGTQAVFLPLEVSEAEFLQIMPIVLRHPQVRAVNVTTPFKTRIDYVDQLGIGLAPLARQVGAVSTLSQQHVGGTGTLQWIGTTLDGLSWVEAYEAVFPQRPLKGARLALFGAGGAGQEILAALWSGQRVPDYVTVIDPERAARQRVETLLKALVPNINFHVVEREEDADAELRQADVLINATALGKADALSPLKDASRIRPDAVVCDLNWWRQNVPQQDGMTPFLTAAKQQGARVMNGLRMAVLHNTRCVVIWLELGEQAFARIAQRMYKETLAAGFHEADFSLEPHGITPPAAPAPPQKKSSLALIDEHRSHYEEFNQGYKKLQYGVIVGFLGFWAGLIVFGWIYGAIAGLGAGSVLAVLGFRRGYRIPQYWLSVLKYPRKEEWLVYKKELSEQKFTELHPESDREYIGNLRGFLSLLHRLGWPGLVLSVFFHSLNNLIDEALGINHMATAGAPTSPAIRALAGGDRRITVLEPARKFLKWLLTPSGALNSVFMEMFGPAKRPAVGTSLVPTAVVSKSRPSDVRLLCFLPDKLTLEQAGIISANVPSSSKVQLIANGRAADAHRVDEIIKLGLSRGRAVTIISDSKTAISRISELPLFSKSFTISKPVIKPLLLLALALAPLQKLLCLIPYFVTGLAAGGLIFAAPDVLQQVIYSCGGHLSVPHRLAWAGALGIGLAPLQVLHSGLTGLVFVTGLGWVVGMGVMTGKIETSPNSPEPGSNPPDAAPAGGGAGPSASSGLIPGVEKTGGIELPQGQPVVTDKIEKLREWARGMYEYILQLAEILNDLPRLQGDVRKESYRQWKEKFDTLGAKLSAFEGINLEEKERIGIAHTLKQNLRIIFALQGPFSDVIDFSGDIASSSVLESMKSQLSEIEFDLRQFMDFQRLVIIGEPTAGSEGYLVNFAASQKISEPGSNPPDAAPAGGAVVIKGTFLFFALGLSALFLGGPVLADVSQQAAAAQAIADVAQQVTSETSSFTAGAGAQAVSSILAVFKLSWVLVLGICFYLAFFFWNPVKVKLKMQEKEKITGMLWLMLGACVYILLLNSVCFPAGSLASQNHFRQEACLLLGGILIDILAVVWALKAGSAWLLLLPFIIFIPIYSQTANNYAWGFMMGISTGIGLREISGEIKEESKQMGCNAGKSYEIYRLIIHILILAILLGFAVLVFYSSSILDTAAFTPLHIAQKVSQCGFGIAGLGVLGAMAGGIPVSIAGEMPKLNNSNGPKETGVSLLDTSPNSQSHQDAGDEELLAFLRPRAYREEAVLPRDKGREAVVATALKAHWEVLNMETGEREKYKEEKHGRSLRWAFADSDIAYRGKFAEILQEFNAFEINKAFRKQLRINPKIRYISLSGDRWFAEPADSGCGRLPILINVEGYLNYAIAEAGEAALNAAAEEHAQYNRRVIRKRKGFLAAATPQPKKRPLIPKTQLRAIYEDSEQRCRLLRQKLTFVNTDSPAELQTLVDCQKELAQEEKVFQESPDIAGDPRLQRLFEGMRHCSESADRRARAGKGQRAEIAITEPIVQVSSAEPGVRQATQAIATQPTAVKQEAPQIEAPPAQEIISPDAETKAESPQATARPEATREEAAVDMGPTPEMLKDKELAALAKEAEQISAAEIAEAARLQAAGKAGGQKKTKRRKVLSKVKIKYLEDKNLEVYEKLPQPRDSTKEEVKRMQAAYEAPLVLPIATGYYEALARKWPVEDFIDIAREAIEELCNAWTEEEVRNDRRRCRRRFWLYVLINIRRVIERFINKELAEREAEETEVVSRGEDDQDDQQANDAGQGQDEREQDEE